VGLQAGCFGGTPSASQRGGAFATTFIAFFLAEMGDKTQVTTFALAAGYDALTVVVLRTTQ
jgi:putative Ca2+/H+ antiporter (TMEM165/GDT1 family)